MTRPILHDPLWLAGKLGVWGLANAVTSDQLSNRSSLVDTGTDNSILPHHSAYPPSGSALAAWSRWPELSLQVGQACAACVEWPVSLGTFLLAPHQCPSIGVDFIRAHHLLMDPVNNRLMDTPTLQSFPTSSLQSN